MKNWSYYFNYANGKLYWAITDSNRVSVDDEAGTTRPDGYVMVKCKNIRTYAHRIIWEMFNGEIPEDMIIDHINGNPNDNRIENLQCIKQKQNLQRSFFKKKFSLFKKNDKYVAQRTINGKNKNLGYYGTPCGAMMAYNTSFIG